jgi:hypothetical protein
MTNSADQEYSAVAGDARWQAIGKVDPRCLGQARWLALNIVQWPARIANSYVTGSTWPERTWMAWQPAADAIVTRSFDRALSLRLDLRTLELCFLEQGHRVPHAFDPEARSPAEAEAWILVELLHQGIDRTRFSKALPYDIPDLLTGDAEDYAPQSCAAELTELAAWYHNAVLSFATAAKEMGMSDPHIECSPQNLTMICRLGSDSKGPKRPAVELGFSPGRRAKDEPYFYVTPGSGAEEPRGVQAVMSSSTVAAAGAPQESLSVFLRDAMSDVSQR